jgi:hypothetical protein
MKQELQKRISSDNPNYLYHSKIEDSFRLLPFAGSHGALNMHPILSKRIYGNCTNIHGLVHKDLKGDVTFLWGDVTGVYGDATLFIGDLDKCEITDKERENGVNIEDLYWNKNK